jgi:hypothetical protein
MSSSTSTPAARSSEARSLAGTCWRLVEAQHHVSTLKLVDSFDEQERLEDLMEASKPPVRLRDAPVVSVAKRGDRLARARARLREFELAAAELEQMEARFDALTLEDWNALSITWPWRPAGRKFCPASDGKRSI